MLTVLERVAGLSSRSKSSTVSKSSSVTSTVSMCYSAYYWGLDQVRMLISSAPSIMRWFSLCVDSFCNRRQRLVNSDNGERIRKSRVDLGERIRLTE